MLKILNAIGPTLSPEAKKILSPFGSVKTIAKSQAELLKHAVDCDVLLVQLGVKVDKQVIDRAKKLRLVATTTTGLDHIDLSVLKKKGVELISLKNERKFLNTITGTAELAFGLIIDLARRTPFAFEAVKKYQWDNEDWRGFNLRGKTLGIVGLGRLGSLMADYGRAFQMKVLAHDPFIKDAEFKRLKAEKCGLKKLLSESDFISLHVHLDARTKNLINKTTLRLMKPTAYLVNTSRGGIVNEGELLSALKNRKLAGYGADVLANETAFEKKHFARHPLVEYARRRDNCIITPHVGGMTHESRKATDIFIAKKVSDWIKNNVL